MAESYRLFLALWPDREVRDHVTHYLQSFYPLPPSARAVSIDNLHITLRYIGPVDGSQLACIRQVMAGVQLPSFEIELDHQGYWSRPKVAWLGCHRPPMALVQLVGDINTALGTCGIESESRPYLPHMTVFRKYAAFPSIDIPPICWSVRSFALVLSESRPEGVHYSVLHQWPDSDAGDISSPKCPAGLGE